MQVMPASLNLVRSSGDEVAVEQIGRDRPVVAAVGGPHPTWPGHDGPDIIMPNQSLGCDHGSPPTQSLQLDMDARAAITAAGVAMDSFDFVDEVSVGSRSSALRARAQA